MIRCRNWECESRFICFRYMAYFQKCRPDFATFIPGTSGKCGSFLEIPEGAKLDPVRITQREYYASTAIFFTRGEPDTDKG